MQFALLRRLCYKNKNKTSSGMITRKIEVCKVAIFEKKKTPKAVPVLTEQCCDVGTCLCTSCQTLHSVTR